VLIPAVQEWLTTNPVSFVAALAAVNVLVRFVTHGRVNLLSTDEGDGKNGGVAPAIIGLIAAGALMGGLPSCATTTAPDGTVTRQPDVETIQASTGFAQWLYEVFTFERDRAAEEAEAVEVTATK
jgi:hypothetical protein